MLHSIRFDQLGWVAREGGIVGHFYMVLISYEKKSILNNYINNPEYKLKEKYRSPLFLNATHPERVVPYLFISILEKL